MNEKDLSGFRKVLDHLKWYGLCFLKSVPAIGGGGSGQGEEGQEGDVPAVERVATRFGNIRETFYGRSWDVKAVKNARNIAYTSLCKINGRGGGAMHFISISSYSLSPLDLGLHADLMYFESPPGLQFLHSLKNSVKGGESLFLDSFKAVHLLKEQHPQHYTTLTQIPVTFHYQKDGHFMHYMRPTIVDSNPNEPLLVNYAPPFQGPLQLENQERDAPRFYAAMNAFEEIVQSSQLIYSTRLEKGSLVIFANRRVFHGRNEFDSGSGDRHFKGTYLDWDVFKDRERTV